MRRIFIGLYGDTSKESNRQIIERAQLIPGRRRDRYPADVYFYDSQSARVWDQPTNAKVEKKGQ